MMGYEIFPIFKMRYELLFTYVKLSSALVPRIKNYNSLINQSIITISSICPYMGYTESIDINRGEICKTKIETK